METEAQEFRDALSADFAMMTDDELRDLMRKFTAAIVIELTKRANASKLWH